MSDDNWVNAVARGTDREVQDAIANAESSSRLRGPGGLGAIAQLGNELAANALLSKRTQAMRLRAVLNALKPPSSQLEDLADVARGFPAHLRLAVADWLPRGSRHRVYGVQVDHRAGRAVDAGHTEHTTPTITGAPSIRGETDETGPSHSGGEEREPYPPVLLLSHPDHQEGNRVQLERAGFDPVVVEDVAALDRLLATNREICAFVVDESLLSLMDPQDQRQLIEKLGSYSTFAAIRIDDGGLKLSQDEVTRLIKEVRHLVDVPTVDTLSFQPGGTIREAELIWFHRSGELLQSHQKGVSFELGDLSPADTQLLAAAVRRTFEPEDVEGIDEGIVIRFLPGGLSGARLIAVSCGDSRTLVGKIAPKPEARAEMRRFRTYIQGWDDHLHPVCHFHGESAVILSALVRSGSSPRSPAISLETSLAALWNAQWMRDDSVALQQQETLVAAALKGTAAELARLNASKPAGADDPAFVDPPITHMADLEDDGFDYGLGADAITAREKAGERYRRLKGEAVVHGDIHLQNVLLRGEADIQLIDFAASGPGHPAIDLVRFELALYLGPVRQFESYHRCVDFQRALTVERKDVERLRGDYPAFFNCNVNAACAHGMVAARDHAIAVLRGHGGDPMDYVAAKFLVAWQNQGIIGMNPGLARAIIDALVPEILSW